MDKKIIDKLYQLISKATKEGEVPVACVITKNGKIIASAYNKKETRGNPLMHAEILAISNACKKEKTWRLNECNMYVTLEPCSMCKEVINEARINQVFYILNSKVSKKVMTKYKKYDIKNDIFKEKLMNFFKTIR